jgi:diguanylate cyclase (GGDEF)-like protein
MQLPIATRSACAGLVPWRSMPAAVRILAALLIAATALTTFRTLSGLGGPMGPFDDVLYNGVLFGSALLCLLSGVLRRSERLPWLLAGAALALWAAGNLYWTFRLSGLAEAPYPSVADALWLAFLPVSYAAVMLLVRERMPQRDSRMWLDGLIAALTTGAVSAAVVFGAVQATTGGSTAAVATNLAYPLGDMILIGTIVGVMAACRSRLDSTWVTLGAGLGIWTVVDSIYLFEVANGTYVEGRLLDIGWIAGALLMGLSAWQPPVPERATGDELPGIAAPVVLSLGSLVVLVVDHFERVNVLALALATASVVAMVVRLVLTHRDSRSNLVTTRRQARTDTLTGLGNRLALMTGLERALASGEPHVLLLFDLDGFKNYNDSYGHPAGDALLTRLGSRLQAAVADHGSAYRMGGDEFCVLAPWSPDAALDPLLLRAREALTEQGDGFRVGASGGHVALPSEAADGAEAMRVADRRLYAEKHSGRVPARLQSAGVLRRALDEWDTELSEHTDDVAALARAVAVRLGLDEEEVERVGIAAELHDIGKIAIPRSILHKPGPLDEDEWAFVRRHTLIGERIVQGAPALSGVAGLIRSSHERWDGDGYPDGLVGGGIPLGAQIVFVCDAFSAMTTDRCYQPGMSELEAVAELRRHAGRQFSPAAVDAFVAARAARLAAAA